MTADINRARSALALIFTGDALSMPVHWFYRRGDILKYFPPAGITRFEAAPDQHPGAIMALHSTGRGGRGAQSPEQAVVGNLILKDKAALWNQRGVHYHHGMPAGENTLNAWCARWMINWLAGHDIKQFSVEQWLEHYVAQMTAEPATHPDTYAESYHREFFANVRQGKPLLQCGGYTHDTPSMGALVTVAPLALAMLPSTPLHEVQSACRDLVYATHPDDMLMKVVDSYVQLMSRLLNPQGDDPQDFFIEAASVVPGGDIRRFLAAVDDDDAPILKRVSEDSEVIGNTYSPACYITDSWPGVCYLAARYYRSPETALLVNTNLGGENAHRGSVLGTLVGLTSGEQTGFCRSLYRHESIANDIEVWCDRFYGD
ncbi:MAG: ADP-ribosylglycohydrolase family protein [Pseudomonadota bacterium]